MKRVIYKITNSKNDKIYIGSAEYFNARKAQHLFHLRKGSHVNKKIQHFVNKYGIDTLSFEIIHKCSDIEDLIATEQFYIDALNPWFNICKVAGSNKGLKRTPEQIEKAKQTKIKNGTYRKTGKKHSEESKKKIGDAHRGKVISKEQRIKQSEKMKGRKLTKEHIQKREEGRIRNGTNKHTEETKRKLSELRKGEGNGMYGKKGKLHPNYGKKIIHKNISKRCCKIINTDTGEIYHGYRRCAEALGFSFSKVYKYLTGVTKRIKINIKYYEEN